MKVPGVIVLAFEFDEGDEGPFPEILERIREALPDQLASICAALGSAAQDVNDLTRHW